MKKLNEILRRLFKNTPTFFRWTSRWYLNFAKYKVPAVLLAAIIYVGRLPTLSELVPLLTLTAYMLAMSAVFKWYAGYVSKELR